MASNRIGSFTVPAGTGNLAVTGVGFQPRAVIFWGNRRSADGVSSNVTNLDMPTFWGVATSSTARGCVVSASDWGGSWAGTLTNVCISQRDSAGAVTYAADFVSLDADGFTVNFTTANATAYVINYHAIGGADVSARVLTNTSPATTGNQAWTGAGFAPTAILVATDYTSPQGGLFSHTCLGAANSTTSRWANHSALYRSGSNNKVFYTTNVVARLNTAADAVMLLADLASFDADGFTLNFSTASNAFTMIALCLGGSAGYRAGAITQATGTGNQATTGVGFQTNGVLLHGGTNTSLATVQTTGMMTDSYGAASSTSARAVVSAQEGASTGVARLDRANLLSVDTDSSTTRLVAAGLVSLDADGFTLNYSVADATARYIGYFAIQGAAPTPPGDVRFHHKRGVIRPAPFRPGLAR